jgi:hypothetical protein
VTFANEGQAPVPGQKIEERIRNLHDRDRVTCQLCGECDVGCNFGAKNTLDYNYLTHAKHHGAELWTLCDVRTLEPRDGGGYEVGYAALGEPDGSVEGNGRPAPLRKLTCDRLILSAGTLGTANLLLRNRSALPRMSRKLGSRFCGNGDLLTLALNCSEELEGVRVPRVVDPGYGPVITSTARVPAWSTRSWRPSHTHSRGGASPASATNSRTWPCGAAGQIASRCYCRPCAPQSGPRRGNRWRDRGLGQRGDRLVAYPPVRGG